MRPGVADVVAVIARAGGVASLAHPGLLGIDDRIAGYAESGLSAIEVRHRDHTPTDEAYYRRLAATLDLAVSGGSDFHGDDVGSASSRRWARMSICGPGSVTLGAEDFAALEARAARRPQMTPVLQITGVQKRYQSLRPLRIQELTIAAGERVAVSGFDAGAAEVLVNLVTGASLPDEGEVRVLGHRTADIVDGDEWLASLDRFGIVSPRGVLLEGATLEQNLAMPFTLRSTRCRPMLRPASSSLARAVRHSRG